MLEIIKTHRPENSPSVEQISNFLNKEVTHAYDKEKCLSEIEANILIIKNNLDYVLHVVRNHPMHILNTVDASVLYSVDEALERTKLDRQKLIKLIKKGTIPGVKDGKVYLPYKWAVDNFMFSSNSTVPPKAGATTTTHTASMSTRTNKTTTFTIDRYLK